jgi:hypothetical protein
LGNKIQKKIYHENNDSFEKTLMDDVKIQKFLGEI